METGGAAGGRLALWAGVVAAGEGLEAGAPHASQNLFPGSSTALHPLHALPGAAAGNRASAKITRDACVLDRGFLSVRGGVVGSSAAPCRAAAEQMEEMGVQTNTKRPALRSPK